MYRLIAVLIGYAFGCLQNGYFLARKLAGIDVREYGSGGAGMTNVMRVLGFKPGVVVLVADIFKAVAAFALASAIFGWDTNAGLYAGLGVIIGHNFPFYLDFRGGKGVASTLGLILLLDWRVALIIYGIMLIIAAVTRYISLASLTMSVLIPILLAVFGYAWEVVGVTAFLGALAWCMHRANIQRLLKGTENKLFAKKTASTIELPPVNPAEETPPANQGKLLDIAAHGEMYLRIPVKTHVITSDDEASQVFSLYIAPHVRAGDIVFISERAVACTQSRAIRMVDIKPRKLAVFLSKYVQKTPAGIGLGIPETMEMALRECGVPRILFAACISLVGKIFKRKGWFYHVAGPKARGIDGPCDNTLPPYNEYVVLAPDAPGKMAQIISASIGAPVVIVDCNDLGCNLLGASDPKMKESFIAAILRDNPLGQSSEQTPCGIIRKKIEGGDIPCADSADLQETSTTTPTTHT
ncbi:MAG: glycerol-3-phosphate 1-O-acyltransferase PlsY [Defluviitaleaceae bacterium]|nr:glycerol-3-phosphate 1-O-acyltransferase PlsY [Defluviitaleaceae bacterium]MCL2274564.1 glycerol-3-phosphate 1-O-acyltransferase PlsY [Defluviitaleaceae bacterium]